MAEPISIIGGVAAVMQLAKYGFRFIQAASDYPGTFRATPDTIQALLNDVEGFISMVQPLSQKSHAVAHHSPLSSMIDRSIISATSLQGILQAVAIKDNDSMSIKLRKSLSFQRKAKKISSCMLDIERCKINIILHNAAISCHKDTLLSFSPDSPVYLNECEAPKGLTSDMPRKLNFIGRGSLIDLVFQTLADPTLGHKACLFGIGGIGKSQAALHYAMLTRKSSPDIPVFWIDASNQANFRKSLEHIGRLPKGQDNGDSSAWDINRITDWLESKNSGNWIMIVDDIDLGTFGNPQMFLNALPKSSSGSILFTTRNKQTALALVNSPRCVFEMEPMAPDEAYQLFMSELVTHVSDSGVIASLLKHLEYLPLAICRAASYMSMTSTTPNTYLRLFCESEENKDYLLNESFEFSPKEYEAFFISSMASINAIRAQSEAAAQILFKMVCVDPLHVPTSLLATSSPSGRMLKDLGLLKAYSLITSNASGDVFSMNSLVHLGVRSYLKSTNQLYLHASDVFEMLARKFPETNEQYNKLGECKSYLPHALAVWNTMMTNKHYQIVPRIASNTAETLALRISLCLRIMGRYEVAKNYAEHALEWCLKENSPLSDTAITCRLSITAADQYLGNIAVAAKSINTILYPQRKILTTNAHVVTSALGRKGLSLQSQGSYAQAERYHVSVVYRCISLYGVDDLKTLDEQHALALSFIGQRKHNEALDLLQYVLEAMADTLGLRNPKTLTVISNISSAFQLLSQWDQSWTFATQALAGKEEILGVEHPQVLQCKANLAQIYISRGNWMKAEEQTRDVLQKHEAQLGKDHPLSAHILQNLGFILLDQGKFVEAEEALHLVAKRREKRLGAEHGDTLIAKFWLADTYAKQRRWDEALELARKVLYVRRGYGLDELGIRQSETQVHEMQVGQCA